VAEALNALGLEHPGDVIIELRAKHALRSPNRGGRFADGRPFIRVKYIACAPSRPE
jgi:hypothetical protein